MKIPVAKPYFNKDEECLVLQVIRSGWVTQGPMVAEFEKLICQYTGTKYAVATSSATTALFLSLHVLGIGLSDEVLVPSHSFIASANAIVHAGAKPVFVDIDPLTYNLDPKDVVRKVTKKTKAIIPVDQVGLPHDIDAIKAVAQKYHLQVVEDAACALGSTYKGKKIGSLTKLACFSFHPRKPITTGDGGVITTNSVQLAKKLRLFRHQGMSVSDVARHRAKKVIFENYPVVGYNFRMTDIQAAVGVAQMKKLPSILKKRKKLAERYTKAFAKSKYLAPPFVPKDCGPNWQSYLIRLKKNSRITRNGLIQKLARDGIATRRGVMSSHLEPAYRKMFGKISLPESEAATREVIVLPLYPQMTIKEQDFVIEKIFYHLNG